MSDKKAVDKTPQKGKKKAGKAKDKKPADEKEAPKVEEKKKEEKKVEPPKDPRVVAAEDLRGFIHMLEQGVAQKEKRLLTLAVRKMNSLRRRVDAAILKDAVQQHIPDTCVSYIPLMKFLDVLKADSMEVETKAAIAPAAAPAAAMEVGKDKPASSKDSASPAPEDKKKELLPEVEVYINLLVLMLLFDKKHINEAVQCVSYLVNHRLPDFNRRTMDFLSARAYFYYALAYEKVNRLSEIRNTLLSLHRTACLRHDEPGQATLINAILRSYLHYKLYSQADKFRLNVKLPDSRSSNEHARYLYYIGKIFSIQLNYTDAFGYLTQAVRKAPQSGAVGFRQAAQKLLLIVELLMGDIPERATFRQPQLKRALKPYLHLTQAVRVGDLAAFKDAMNTHKALFMRDGVYHLIVRLRQNVIKTGLRKINLSYSRISIQDIAAKLSLESKEDCEYIVAKAIHDGVIDAVIDHDGGFVFSKENMDIYSTTAPQVAFHKRIQFCMDIHKEAVKAFQFPPGAHKVEMPSEGPDLSAENPPEDAS